MDSGKGSGSAHLLELFSLLVLDLLSAVQHSFLSKALVFSRGFGS